MLVKGREILYASALGAVHSQGAEEVPYLKVVRVTPHEIAQKEV